MFFNDIKSKSSSFDGIINFRDVMTDLSTNSVFTVGDIMLERYMLRSCSICSSVCPLDTRRILSKRWRPAKPEVHNVIARLPEKERAMAMPRKLGKVWRCGSSTDRHRDTETLLSRYSVPLYIGGERWRQTQIRFVKRWFSTKILQCFTNDKTVQET